MEFTQSGGKVDSLGGVKIADADLTKLASAGDKAVEDEQSSDESESVDSSEEESSAILPKSDFIYVNLNTKMFHLPHLPVPLVPDGDLDSDEVVRMSKCSRRLPPGRTRVFSDFGDMDASWKACGTCWPKDPAEGAQACRHLCTFSKGERFCFKMCSLECSAEQSLGMPKHRCLKHQD